MCRLHLEWIHLPRYQFLRVLAQLPYISWLGFFTSSNHLAVGSILKEIKKILKAVCVEKFHGVYPVL